MVRPARDRDWSSESRQKGPKCVRLLPKLTRYVTKTLWKDYDFEHRLDYCAAQMDSWQQKAAFVIQFRPETDVSAGQFAGRIEHIASYREGRFHSLDELLAFIDSVLEETKENDPALER